jgi:hypothetical protein
MIDGNFEMKIAGSLHISLFTVPFKIQNLEQKGLKATECKISEFNRHTSHHKMSLFGIFVSLDVFQHFTQFLRNQSKPDIRQALQNALCVSDER